MIGRFINVHPRVLLWRLSPGPSFLLFKRLEQIYRGDAFGERPLERCYGNEADTEHTSREDVLRAIRTQ